MIGFKFGPRSEERLVGVHPDLVKVVRRALELSKVDFSVSEGLRTYARQKELFAAGKSKTMNSRHLSGHAVDLYPVIKVTPGPEWQPEDFVEVVDAMRRAAKAMGIPLTHGADWGWDHPTTNCNDWRTQDDRAHSWRYIAAALAVLAMVAGIWFHGRHAGAASVQADWDAQVVADKEAAEALRESNRLRAQARATTYETQRAAIAARVNKPSQEVENAFHASICPKPGLLGKPLELGDVDIPAVVLEKLRQAGEDY